MFYVFYDCRIVSRTRSMKKAMKLARHLKGWVKDETGAFVAFYAE